MRVSVGMSPNMLGQEEAKVNATAASVQSRSGVVGRHRWAIAEGFIPAQSTGEGRAFESHETACILNANDADAHLEIVLFFEAREPVGPYRVVVPAMRTKHLRFNDLEVPETVPRDTDFASVITSDVPVVVQHTRLDSRQSELALLTTVAFPVD